MTPIDGHTLQSVQAAIEAMYKRRDGSSFTARAQAEYDSLLRVEDRILSPN